MIPKGLIEVDEETGKEKYAEEFAIPSTEDLKSLEVWGHTHPILLKAGRTSYPEAPDNLTEEEKEEYTTK